MEEESSTPDATIMRILMLGWELPPHNSGGLGVACYQLARALSEQGAAIDFVLPFNTPVESQEFMTIHHASSEPAQAETIAYGDNFDSFRPIQRKYSSFVTKQVTVNAPEVIHAHDWLTYEAGIHAKKLTGAPLIAHVHATEFDRAGGAPGNPLIHEIEQHGLLMADHIIAVSHATKRLIMERYHIPASKIEVVHNSVDRPTQAVEVATKTMYTYIRSMQNEGYIAVLAIGRLTLQKGLTYFLHACAKASNHSNQLIFIIAGDGEQRDELLQLSAELGIADKVLFTGFVRGAAWRELYDISDIFVMNSVSEPFGLTALEAAVHDTAIVLSRQSGVGEVLTNVLKFDYWDIDRLADQLINIANSPGLRQELTIGAKRNFETMSWHTAASKLLSSYQILADGARV